MIGTSKSRTTIPLVEALGTILAVAVFLRWLRRRSMARKIKKKWVYRDIESKRLITEAEAIHRRDKNTWTKEEFLILPPEDHYRKTNT